MADLKIDLAGIKLENPIIVASGSLTRTVEQIKRIEKKGAGAAVLKSALLDREYSQAIPSRDGLFPEGRLSFYKVDQMGYITIGGLSQVPAERWAEWVRKLKKESDFTLIACPIATSMEGYIEICKLYEEAGVDAIQLCFAAPLMALRESTLDFGMAGYMVSVNPSLIPQIVNEVKKHIKIPLGAKVVPVGINFRPTLEALKMADLDFLHLCSVAGAGHPGVDVETGKPLHIIRGSGMVGPILKYINFRTVIDAALTLGYKNLHLTASGGAMDWKDVVQYIMFGCTSVQLNSAILQNGLDVIPEIKDALNSYMDRKGYNSIYDFRGIALEGLLGIDDILRSYWDTKGLILPEIDEDKCILCGECEKTCMFDAIKVDTDKGKVVLIEEKCEGDALCMANCPANAIKMKNINLFHELRAKRLSNP